ncbi:MAG: PilZ domain-containing protein [Candidatus Acidiferrales bacterium]
MNNRERRRHERYPCSANVEIDWGSEVLQASIQDISTSGMFVATPNPLWMRAQFSARILLPEILPIDCIVRRIEPGHGMAVEFESLSDFARKSLTDLLGKLSAE